MAVTVRPSILKVQIRLANRIGGQPSDFLAKGRELATGQEGGLATRDVEFKRSLCAERYLMNKYALTTK